MFVSKRRVTVIQCYGWRRFPEEQIHQLNRCENLKTRKIEVFWDVMLTSIALTQEVQELECLTLKMKAIRYLERKL